jgi:hypothetical protein
MNKLPKAITASIDVSKIDKSMLIPGKTPGKGPFLNIKLQNTPNSPYGDDYLVKQTGPKQADGRREETDPLGNARAWDLGGGQSSREQSAGEPEPQDLGPRSSDDLPF